MATQAHQSKRRILISRLVRVALVVSVAVALYVVGQLVSEMIVGQFGLQVRAHNEPLLHRTIMVAMFAYIILLAMPFMPAVEIGLGMIMIFGAKLSLLIYCSTVIALVLSYLGGRLLPPAMCAKVFGFVGLGQAERLFERLSGMSPDQRLTFFLQSSPAGLLPFAVRFRYLVLAILLNIPGNIVLGGGGGLGFVAGMTRVFAFPQYVLTVALAVAPVPLIIHLTAKGGL